MTDNFLGRTIQLFLVDGNPSGLIIAAIHGWTGSVLVSTQSTFAKLLARPEADRTGIYILYGPDPDDSLRMRAYIGEADSVRERIDLSARDRAFWEMAVVITTSDETLTKGHARYLEARLIEMSREADRVVIDNIQEPLPERRRLPEADRANMEAFLVNLKMILPVIGLDLLKSRPRIATKANEVAATTPNPHDTATDVLPRFEIRHKSGVKAFATEQDGEFIVLAGSQALREGTYQSNSYESLKKELIDKGILTTSGDGYEFVSSYEFKSPSAAAAVVLDRNSNGRYEWKLVNSTLTYHQWQEEIAKHI